jgi:hypothetical protein
LVSIRINVITACYSQAKTHSSNPSSGPKPLLAIHSQGLHLLRIAVPTHLLAKAHMYYYQSSSAAKLRQAKGVYCQVLLLGKVSFMQDQARPVRHHSCIEEQKGYDRGHIPRLCLPKELRNSCGARQGRVCLRQSCIDMLVCFLRFMRRERGATKGEIGLVLLLRVVIFVQGRS